MNTVNLVYPKKERGKFIPKIESKLSAKFEQIQFWNERKIRWNLRFRLRRSHFGSNSIFLPGKKTPLKSFSLFGSEVGTKRDSKSKFGQTKDPNSITLWNDLESINLLLSYRFQCSNNSKRQYKKIVKITKVINRKQKIHSAKAKTSTSSKGR